MLKHAGMLEPQRSVIPTSSDCASPELRWRAWIHYETRNRYANHLILHKIYTVYTRQLTTTSYLQAGVQLGYG